MEVTNIDNKILRDILVAEKQNYADVMDARIAEVDSLIAEEVTEIDK